MNTKDYVQELESQLKATFKKADGSTVPFYVKSNESELDKQKTELQKLIDLGNSQGFISDNDAKTMSPSGKAVRLYVQPKCHKEMRENQKIPVCRPICSQSGANSEWCSKFVDFHVKGLVHEIPTFIEDTAPEVIKLYQLDS